MVNPPLDVTVVYTWNEDPALTPSDKRSRLQPQQQDKGGRQPWETVHATSKIWKQRQLYTYKSSPSHSWLFRHQGTTGSYFLSYFGFVRCHINAVSITGNSKEQDAIRTGKVFHEGACVQADASGFDELFASSMVWYEIAYSMRRPNCPCLRCVVNGRTARAHKQGLAVCVPNALPSSKKPGRSCDARQRRS